MFRPRRSVVPGLESVVLKQGALHNPVQKPVVGADRQTLHTAIGLASRGVAQQLGVRVGVRVVDAKLPGHLKATQQLTVAAELKNIGTILVRDE